MNEQDLNVEYDQLWQEIETLMETETIETEHYTLFIKRDNKRVWFDYKPKGYWSTVINGRLEIDVSYFGGRYEEVMPGVRGDIKHSSGGNDDDWTIDSELGFIAAYQDCYERVKNCGEEVKHVRHIAALCERQEEIREILRVAKVEAAVAKHPRVDEAEVRRIVKEAARLKRAAELKYTFVDHRGDLEERTSRITHRGLHWYNDTQPDAQKYAVRDLMGRHTVSLEIAENL